MMGSECGLYIREAPEQFVLYDSLIMTAITTKITLTAARGFPFQKYIRSQYCI